MENTIDVIQVMEEHFPRMSKGHKAIAAYIREHYDSAVFMTAAQLGNELGVSESTVVRFASALGFKGYPDFQKKLAAWVKNKLNSVEKVGAKYGHSSQSEVLKSVLNGDIDKINKTLGLINPDLFEMAAETILKAKTVYVIGLRSCAPLADFLAFYLNMIRSNVKLLTTTSTSETFEQMIRVGEEDCVIGISFPRYSMRTLKALEFAADRNARVISITDNDHSPMCLYSYINLFAASDMVSIVDSLVAPLSLINALVVDLCLKSPDAVKKNLEMLEETWSNYQVYLNDEINFIDDEPMLDYSLTKDLFRKQSNE